MADCIFNACCFMDSNWFETALLSTGADAYGCAVGVWDTAGFGTYGAVVVFNAELILLLSADAAGEPPGLYTLIGWFIGPGLTRFAVTCAMV